MLTVCLTVFIFVTRTVEKTDKRKPFNAILSIFQHISAFNFRMNCVVFAKVKRRKNVDFTMTLYLRNRRTNKVYIC